MNLNNSLLTDFTPFVIFYFALIVRILDNKELFLDTLLKRNKMRCEKVEKEECLMKWENPLAKAHHEFIFTNTSASVIIIIRIIFSLIYNIDFSIEKIIIAIIYFFFSLGVIFTGLKVDWKGIDSFFFSLIAMSIPYFCIFYISGIETLSFNIAFLNASIAIALMLGQHFLIKEKIISSFSNETH